MAGLLLTAVGGAIGASIGGAVLGVSSMVIGQTIGAVLGSAIDSYLFAPSISLTQEGPRLSELGVTSSTEGVPMLRGYGRFRTPGNIIWATRLREDVVVTTQKEGGKGGGGGVTTTTTSYNYYANFAVGLCEGEISSIHRVWADGKLLDLSDLTYRVYKGTETQSPDSLIETKEGAGNAPAYRGLAYIVFEDLLLERFGNRIPQFMFEITRPIKRADNDSVGEIIKGIDLIPGTTEFGYDPDVVEQIIYGGDSGTQVVERRVENNHTGNGKSNWEEALDQLEAGLPNCGTVTLVVTWFGDDLRIGNCTLRPKVENSTKETEPYTWKVSNLERDTATIISTYEGIVAFGGTPNDASVIRAIQDLKTRGFEVMFYPFIIMDIEDGNTLNNPYSDNAAEVGQPDYPWRGRITCSPAPGYVGTVDKTAAAATQVNSFVGAAAAGDFAASGTTVTYSGPSEWSYRRMILHYAHLCDLAGGVDQFCIGTEMVGSTLIRSAASTFPFVDALVTLASDVSGIMGGSTEVGYAADWSEYHSYRPSDGTGDVYYNLDKLWADANIDFIGIDNYMPMSDWRDGTDHLDYLDGHPSIYDIDYLQSNIEGGEVYDWYYASTADRLAQIRTPITDSVYGQDWIYRQKDIYNWWFNSHHDLPGGLMENLATDGATPSTHVIVGGTTRIATIDSYGPYSDAQKLLSGGSTSDMVRTGNIDDGIAAGKKYFAYAIIKRDPDGTNTNDHYRFQLPTSTSTNFEILFNGITLTDANLNLDSFGEVDLGGGFSRLEMFLTCVVTDTTVNMRVGPFSSVSGDSITELAMGIIEIEGSASDSNSTPWLPQSKKIYFTEFGAPAIDKATNQPNVFFDPKSSESFIPYFSSGARDDEIQRQYIRAMIEYWGDAGNNPTSDVYAAKMIDTDKICYWAYDARPWPTFPMDGDSWADQAAWQFGHWISGRIDTVYIPDLLTQLAEDYDVTADYDFSRAYGSCDGFILANIMTFRNAVEPLASLYMFNIIESGATIKATSQHESQSVVTVTLDDIADNGDDEPIIMTRRQETELPASMSVRFIDILKNYESSAASQHREIVEASATPVVDVPVVTDFVRGQQLCDRLLYSAWAGRGLGDFGLLPEFLKLEAGDVITLNANGFTDPMRILSIADGVFRQISSRSFDLGILNTTQGGTRTQVGIPSLIVSAPDVQFMDLPLLIESDNGWQPYVVGYTNPWRGVNIFKSIISSNYALDTQLTGPGYIGETNNVFNAGSTDVWDYSNELSITLYSGDLESLDEESVLNGENAVAIKNTSGNWEIFQFVNATLTGTRQYTLTKLLRGQLGTEDNMEDGLAAGTKVVILNLALAQMSLSIEDIGREYYYKYGPGDKDIGDSTYNTITKTFTGRGLKPYSPVHIEGIDSSGDMIISWIRRTRIQGDTWDLEEVPLNETFETYEIDVLDGSDNVVRTLSVTDATTVTYTAAQQATDGISAPFDVTIYQLSERVGRGIGRRATLNG